MSNLRLAFRTLFKTPFLTIVAIISPGLGIGANAAIFSLFDQMLLRSLPVHEPDRLVNLGAPGPKPGSNSCNNQGPCSDVFSYPMFRDLERVQTSFEGLAAHRSFAAALSFRGQTLSGDGMSVSGSYFPPLGVLPALGRSFTPADDRTVGGHFIVVLSETYWRTRFDANPNILTETLIVNGQAMTIVGVTARGFEGTSLGSRPHVHVPLTMRGLMQPGFVRATPNANGFENRRNYWAYVFGRLKPGVSIEQARTAVNGLYRSIINDVESPSQQGMSDQTMARFTAKEVTITEGYRGQSGVHGRRADAALLAARSHGVRAADRLREHCQSSARARCRSGRRNGSTIVDRREPSATGDAGSGRVGVAGRAGRSFRTARIWLDTGFGGLAAAR